MTINPHSYKPLIIKGSYAEVEHAGLIEIERKTPNTSSTETSPVHDIMPSFQT